MEIITTNTHPYYQFQFTIIAIPKMYIFTVDVQYIRILNPKNLIDTIHILQNYKQKYFLPNQLISYILTNKLRQILKKYNIRENFEAYVFSGNLTELFYYITLLTDELF